MQDARVLEDAGFDAVMVQNSLDRPTRERIDQLAVAQLSAITSAVVSAVSTPVGVNVVKNDGPAAVAIAAASGASFVRVKVLTGAVLSAEGIVQACGEETQALRLRCGHEISVWADVYEPTSRSLLADDFDAALVDAVDFGAAQAVIVTGHSATESIALAERARKRASSVIIGGRIDSRTVVEALNVADSVIIGSALKAEPGIRGPVDANKAAEIASVARDRTTADR